MVNLRNKAAWATPNDQLGYNSATTAGAVRSAIRPAAPAPAPAAKTPIAPSPAPQNTATAAGVQQVQQQIQQAGERPSVLDTDPTTAVPSGQAAPPPPPLPGMGTSPMKTAAEELPSLLEQATGQPLGVARRAVIGGIDTVDAIRRALTHTGIGAINWAGRPVSAATDRLGWTDKAYERSWTDAVNAFNEANANWADANGSQIFYEGNQPVRHGDAYAASQKLQALLAGDKYDIDRRRNMDFLNTWGGIITGAAAPAVVKNVARKAAPLLSRVPANVRNTTASVADKLTPKTWRGLAGRTAGSIAMYAALDPGSPEWQAQQQQLVANLGNDRRALEEMGYSGPEINQHLQDMYYDAVLPAGGSAAGPVSTIQRTTGPRQESAYRQSRPFSSAGPLDSLPPELGGPGSQPQARQLAVPGLIPPTPVASPAAVGDLVGATETRTVRRPGAKVETPSPPAASAVPFDTAVQNWQTAANRFAALPLPADKPAPAVVNKPVPDIAASAAPLAAAKQKWETAANRFAAKPLPTAAPAPAVAVPPAAGKPTPAAASPMFNPGIGAGVGAGLGMMYAASQHRKKRNTALSTAAGALAGTALGLGANYLMQPKTAFVLSTRTKLLMKVAHYERQQEQRITRFAQRMGLYQYEKAAAAYRQQQRILHIKQALKLPNAVTQPVKSFLGSSNFGLKFSPPKAPAAPKAPIAPKAPASSAAPASKPLAGFSQAVRDVGENVGNWAKANPVPAAGVGLGVGAGTVGLASGASRPPAATAAPAAPVAPAVSQPAAKPAEPETAPTGILSRLANSTGQLVNRVADSAGFTEQAIAGRLASMSPEELQQHVQHIPPETLMQVLDAKTIEQVYGRLTPQQQATVRSGFLQSPMMQNAMLSEEGQNAVVTTLSDPKNRPLVSELIKKVQASNPELSKEVMLQAVQSGSQQALDYVDSLLTPVFSSVLGEQAGALPPVVKIMLALGGTGLAAGLMGGSNGLAAAGGLSMAGALLGSGMFNQATPAAPAASQTPPAAQPEGYGNSGAKATAPTSVVDPVAS